MKRRVCAALLALVLCVCALPVNVRAEETLESFADLDRTAWYAPGVRFCLRNGLMTGYGNRIRLFAPNTPMTRAQFVTILWRIAGEPKTGLSMQYYDVPDDAWYADAARWALSENLMSGYSTSVFAPDDPITREQIVVFLWHLTECLNGAAPHYEAAASLAYYGDCGEISDFALAAMEWAVTMGIVNGYRDAQGRSWLMPWGNSSRAVVATMLMRYCIDMGLYE